MTDDEMLVLAAFLSGSTEMRIARNALDNPVLVSLLQRRLLVEMRHDFGEHVAVLRLTSAGQAYLRSDGQSYH
ncbi:MAG: hypothetical protein U1E62_05535 [Alsobacter sp.]